MIWNYKWHEFVKALRTSKKSQRQLDEIVVLLNVQWTTWEGKMDCPSPVSDSHTWRESFLDTCRTSSSSLFGICSLISWSKWLPPTKSMCLWTSARRRPDCAASTCVVPWCPFAHYLPRVLASFVWGSDGSSVDQLHSTLGKSADSGDPVGDATKPGSLVVEMYAMTSWHSMYFCFKLCFNHAKHDRHFFPVSVLRESLWAIPKHALSTGHFLHTSSLNVRWSSYQSYDVCFNPPRSPWIGWVFAVPWSAVWVNGELNVLMVFCLIFWYCMNKRSYVYIYITINYFYTLIYSYLYCNISQPSKPNLLYTNSKDMLIMLFHCFGVPAVATTSEAMLWGKMVRRFWPRPCPAARWQIYNCKVTWMKLRKTMEVFLGLVEWYNFYFFWTVWKCNNLKTSCVSLGE